MNKNKRVEWNDKMDEWILSHMDESETGFSKAFPNFKHSPQSFYSRKSELKTRSKKPNKNYIQPIRQYSYRTLYQSLTTIPMSELGKDELKGMERMIDVLQKFTKIKIEMVIVQKGSQPAYLEIRETQNR